MNTETNTIEIPQKVFKEIRWHLIHFYELDDYIKRRENQLREELFDYYHFLAAKGMGHLLKTVSRVKRTINPKLEVGGILLTLVNKRTNLSKETINDLKENYGRAIKLYNSQIPLAVKTAESTSRGKSIFKYDKNSKVAIAYENFAKEVLADDRERLKKSLIKLRN